MTTTGFIASTEVIASNTGAGSVVTNELKAMARVFDDIKVLDANIIGCPAYNVPGNPFFIDYITSQIVRDRNQRADVAHFNGDPFGRTIEELKKVNPDVKIVADCPAHDLDESIREWNSTYGQYPFAHLTHSFLKRLYVKHIADADIVLAASRMSKRWIKKNIGNDDIRVLRHGTYVYDYVPLNNDFKVGYLGTIGPDKGLKYIVTAWGAMEHKDAELHFAGKYTDSLAQWKVALLKLNPDAQMFLRGYIDYKWDFYNEMSVYVQPSVTEGFGIPLLEAMAAGRAVISSKGVGASELIKDGKNGLLFDPRDSAQLLYHINYLYDNPSEIKKLGDAARKTAKRYTWDKIQKKYIKIYKELL